MRKPTLLLLFLLMLPWPSSAQGPVKLTDLMEELPRPHDYVLKRISSADPTGANLDARTIPSGETLTILDEAGPGSITHIWITIYDEELAFLKKLVLRMYWDGEATPSVEAPIGDFFGLGLGEYFMYQSLPLVVGSEKALNSFFPMP